VILEVRSPSQRPFKVSRIHPRVLSLAALAALLCLTAPSSASAQMGRMGRGMTPGAMPRPSGATNSQADKGPAEAAPEDESDEDAPIGQYAEKRRAFEVLEFDGYFRFRTDWFHNLHLGQGWVEPASSNAGPPPFPRSISCGRTEGGCDDKALGNANMRLRLEPIVNVTDQVRVLAQIDVLDNTIAGSTPDSLVQAQALSVGNNDALYPILSNSQDPPTIGRNSFTSSIRAKRAWAEIDSEFGRLVFGRMPWHWGRGMFFNHGNCLDCDGGTTVDRVMGMTVLYGHQVALGWDFGPSGRTLNQTQLGLRDLEAPPLDLAQVDDTFQLTASILKRDEDERFRARAAQGEVVFNYGFQLVYRSQEQAIYPDSNPENNLPSDGASALDDEQLGARLQTVDARVFIPDVWFKLGWRALTLEFESAAVLGRVGNAGPLVTPENTELNLRQLGWVLNAELALFKNAFFVGLETGGATGDQAENPRQYLNYRWRRDRQPAGDNTLARFHFSPDYHVDQILFRRLLGTVTNAIYIKPQMAYWLNLAAPRQLGLQVSAIYSAANVRVATPGNATNYGIEVNAGLTYRNPEDRFYAGFTWGVLFPFAALSRPAALQGGVGQAGEGADTAQVLRTFLGVTF